MTPPTSVTPPAWRLIVKLLLSLTLFALQAPTIHAYTGIVVRGCGDASREVPNLIGDIPPEHTFTIFDSFEASAWTAALGTAQFLMIPEEEVTFFSSWLPSAYHEGMRLWVANGGHFILIGPTRGVATLETLFAFTYASSGIGAGTSSKTTEGGSYTTGYHLGPASLPGSNAVVSVNPSNPSPLVMYRSSAGPTVMEYLYWKGMVTILGFDWFESPTPYQWAAVLAIAIANTRRYCRNGFVPVGNTCVGRFDLPYSMGFDAARTYCQSLGSGVDVASVNWPAEMLGLWNLRGSVNSWTGLRDVEVEGTFKNVDGTTPSNIWWYPGEPNDSSGREDCVELMASLGTWTDSLNDLDCGLGLPSVFCEHAPAVDFSCPVSFDPVGKTCMRLLAGSFTYTQAIAACESLGVSATLGSIHNLVESEYSYMYPSYTYLGGDDGAFEGIFRWLDGSPFFYTSWNSGEPNDSGGVEDCIHVTSSTNIHANWNDFPCANIMPFALCRVDPRIPSATPTPSRTSTRTRTPSPTSSRTRTPSPTSSRTRTPTPSSSHTHTTSPSSSHTPTTSPSSSHTHTPTHSATHTPTHTPSRTPTSSASATHTHTPSSSRTSTLTSSPSATHTRSQTSSKTPSVTSTPSPTASSTATPTPTHSRTPTAALTPTGTPTPTTTPSMTPSPTQTPSHSHTHSPSTSTSATSSPSVSTTRSPTGTMSPSATPTHSASASLTMTPSALPPFFEPAVPGEPVSGRLGAQEAKQYVLAGSSSGVLPGGGSSATSGSTASEEEDKGPVRLVEVTVSTGSTDEVLAVKFQASSDARRRRVRLLNARPGSSSTRLLAASSPTASSGSSAQSFPVTRLKPLSGLSCSECASCSFNKATNNMMLFDNEQLLVTLSSGGLSSSSNFNLVLEEPQFDLGNLSTVAAVNTTVNCASIKSFGFDLQETRGTVVVSASVLGVSHNAVLFLKHGYPPTPTDFDARMPFRKDARLAFSAQGPPLGSVARIPAKQGRYFVGVAADVANFEYDDFPLVATRSFLACCNASAPPSFSLVIELQDAGDSYETAVLFPVVAFGGPLALFMLVALAKLWCKAPNSHHKDALSTVLVQAKTSRDESAVTRNVQTLAANLVLWANASQMRALLASSKQATRRGGGVTDSPNLQLQAGPESQAWGPMVSSPKSHSSSFHKLLGDSGLGRGDDLSPTAIQTDVRTTRGSADAAVTVMEAGGLEQHGVVLGAAPGMWWIVALAIAAVTGPSFLYQYGLAFRAHQLGEANQCNYNYMCKRDIRIWESGIPAFNATWAPIASVLVGFFMCAYTFVEQRRRVPASELTVVHRRSPPYHMFYAAGMGAIGTGLSGSCFSLCPHAWLPASEMAFLALTIYLLVMVVGRRLAQSAVDRQKAGPIVSASALSSLVSLLLLLSLVANRNSIMWNIVLVLCVPAISLACGIAVAGLAGDPWTHSSALWKKLKSLLLPPGLLALAIGGPVPMRLLMLGCHVFAALLAFSLKWHIMTFFVADGVCLACLFTTLYVGNKMLVRTCTPARRLARRLSVTTPPQDLPSSIEYIGFPSLVFLVGAAVCALAAVTYAQLMEQDLKHSEATRHEHERCRFLFYDDDALARFWVAGALGSFFMFAFHADDDVLFPSGRRVKAYVPSRHDIP